MEREAIRKSAYVERGEPHGGLGGRCAEPREPAVTPGQLAETHRGESARSDPQKATAPQKDAVQLSAARTSRKARNSQFRPGAILGGLPPLIAAWHAAKGSGAKGPFWVLR